jgi:hypothetical protein
LFTVFARVAVASELRSPAFPSSSQEPQGQSWACGNKAIDINGNDTAGAANNTI